MPKSIITTPPPSAPSVGRPIPASGRVAVVGVAEGRGVFVGTGQVQSVSVRHAVLLHSPLVAVPVISHSIPEPVAPHWASVVQVIPHVAVEVGVAVGVLVAVGVGVFVDVGVEVGVFVGVADGVASSVIVNVRLQAGSPNQSFAAAGSLSGAVGAILSSVWLSLGITIKVATPKPISRTTPIIATNICLFLLVMV